MGRDPGASLRGSGFRLRLGGGSGLSRGLGICAASGSLAGGREHSHSPGTEAAGGFEARWARLGALLSSTAGTLCPRVGHNKQVLSGQASGRLGEAHFLLNPLSGHGTAMHPVPKPETWASL